MKKLVILTLILVCNFRLFGQWSFMSGPNDVKCNYDMGLVLIDRQNNIYSFGSSVDSNYSHHKYYFFKWSGTGWDTYFSDTLRLKEIAFVDKAGSVYFGGNRHILSKWDGSQWTRMDSTTIPSFSVGGIVEGATGKLYAVGNNTNSNGIYYVAEWDGVSWNLLNGLNYANVINSLCTDPSGNLYAVGKIMDANYQPYVAKWDGVAWSNVGSFNTNIELLSIVSDTAGSLYTLGYTMNNAESFTKGDGTGWRFIHGEPYVYLQKLHADGFGNVYAVYNKTIWPAKSAIYKWNGYHWFEVGGENSFVNHDEIYDLNTDTAGNLYVWGRIFDTLGYMRIVKYTNPPAVYTYLKDSMCMGGVYNFNGVSITHSGTYKDILQARNGADSIVVLTLSERPFPSPTPNFILEEDITTPHNWFIINKCSGGTPPITYEWSWGDGQTSTGPYPTHVYSSSGYYKICVSLTSADGCYIQGCKNNNYVYKQENDASIVTINVVDSVPAIINNVMEPMEEQPSFYPNPCEICYSTIQAQDDYGYEVKDLLGNTINSKIAHVDNRIRIDMTNQPSGVYMVFNQRKGIVYKLVKQ